MTKKNRERTRIVDLKSILRHLHDIRKQTNELLKRNMDLIKFQYVSAIKIATKTQSMCLTSIMKENVSYEQSDLDKLRNYLQYFTSACRYRDVVSDLKRSFQSGTQLRRCETDVKNGFSWKQQRNEHNASYVITNLIRRICMKRKRRAVIAIQSRYRTYITKSAYNIEIETKRNAARIIQYAFREMRAKVRGYAARIVQRYFQYVKIYNQRWKCARSIQSTWRCVRERRKFRNQYKACMKLQIWRRRCREQSRLMSVSIIQRATRHFLHRCAQIRTERARRRHAGRTIGRWLLKTRRTRVEIQNRASNTLIHFFRQSRRRCITNKNPAIDEDDDDKVKCKQPCRRRRRSSRKKRKKKRRETYELPPLISNRRKILKEVDDKDSVVVVVSRPPLGKLRVPIYRMRRMSRRE